MTLKAILFDKDGTLIDSVGTWVPLYKQLLAQEHSSVAADIEAMMAKAGYDPDTGHFHAGSPLAAGTTFQLVQLWWPDASPAVHQRIARRLDQEYAPLARQTLQPLMPLAPILQSLRDMGFKLAIGTNDSEGSARGQAEVLGITRYFDAIIGSDSVAVPKPSGQMIRHFAKQAQVDCESIVMVGDNGHDIEEARNGGAGLAVAVLTGNSRREHFVGVADHIIDSVAGLPDLFRGM